MADLRVNSLESWLNIIWDALHGYRNDCILEGDEPHYDEEWNDNCTAMAWLREALDLPDEIIKGGE